jgi:beta-lactamase regulating signal transducer with metallopeptidase domain
VEALMNMPLWFSNLLSWSVQIALLVLAAGFLARLLEIRQPRVVLMYWRVLLTVGLALPFLQPWHRQQSTGAIILAPDYVGIPTAPPAPTATHWYFVSLQNIAEMVGILILAGILVRFIILAVGLLKLRRFRQMSAPMAPLLPSAVLSEQMCSQVNAHADFRLSGDVDSPVTFGFMKPVILLPESFLSMNSRFQAAIACHELLHVRRHDWAHHLAEETIRAMFWFHPAIAWLISRVRLAREQVVDLEVVRITQARKTYLQALLEFTVWRIRAAAIPAPPFLAERQLAERVALMLKEVRMSRTRLVLSLTGIACCLAFTSTLTARTFPFKSGPKGAQDAAKGGVEGGVSGVVEGGVSGGIRSQSADQATVDRSTIWTDTVKKGPMIRQVRGLGKLVRSEGSENLIARVTLLAALIVDVRPSQNATVDTRKGLIKGHVTRINTSSSDENRTVDIGLDGALPEGSGVDLPIDATIDIEKLADVVYVGRPVHCSANTSTSLFKLVNDGTGAARVKVKLGRASVQTIEILDGLKPGDQIILSDMSEWDNVDQIHLK